MPAEPSRKFWAPPIRVPARDGWHTARADPHKGRPPQGREPPMNVMMSWARSTLANVDSKLSRTERHYDVLLIAVMVVLALASIFLFSR